MRVGWRVITPDGSGTVEQIVPYNSKPDGYCVYVRHDTFPATLPRSLFPNSLVSYYRHDVTRIIDETPQQEGGTTHV